MAKVDTHELKKFQAQLQQIAAPKERQRFYEDCLKDLVSRFLTKVIKKTPTGKGRYEVIRKEDGSVQKYKRGKRKGKVKFKRIAGGGTLKRGWAVLKNSIHVQKIGNTYQVELVNNTPYASYVEYGHVQTPGKFIPILGKRLKKSFAEGKSYMTLSAREVEDAAPAILQRKIQRYFEERLNGK